MPQNHYSTRLGAILTMIGMAVGLGNVWRFPYMMGSYGGSAFLFIYIVFTIFFAFPALLTEISVGRKTKGTIEAFKSLLGDKAGSYFGYFIVGVVTIAGSYYAVVVANVVFTTYFSMAYGFTAETIPEFHNQLSTGWLQFIFTALLIIGALAVSYLGLKRGIEKISLFIMPFFVLSILYLIGYSWGLEGASERVIEFLRPDFSSIGSSEIFAALGQAFFSVGLGGTFVIVYAHFLPEKQNTTKIAAWTAFGDLGSSLLVSLFLIPTMLVLGMKMDAGPSLIFHTLPELFSSLPGGRLVGPLFMISLSMVAFLSLIAAYHVPISSITGGNVSRNEIIMVFGLLQLILAMPSTVYPEIIGVLDLVFGSGMQVIGSMLIVIGAWWGLKRAHYKDNAELGSPAFTRFIIFWMKWFLPVSLLIVLITYIYTSI